MNDNVAACELAAPQWPQKSVIAGLNPEPNSSCFVCVSLLLQGLKTASFYYPGGGANYSGQAVNRVLVEEALFPDDNETEWRQNIDTVMSWFSEEDFHLVTLYYGEPDNVGHRKGPDHPDRKDIIRQIDRTIGYLREAIGRHDLTDTLNVVITSDHGMTTIKKRPQVDEIILNKYLNLLKLASFEILDYGGFGILTPRPGKEQEVFDALSNAPNLTVYKKNELPESFHLAKSERLPPIVVVADLGFNLNSVSFTPNILHLDRLILVFVLFLKKAFGCCISLLVSGQ